MKIFKLIMIAFLLMAPVAAFAQPTPPISGSAQVDPLPGHVTIIQTAPAPSSTPAATISVGTFSGEVLNWVAMVFGTPVAGFLILWLKALAKKAGIEVSQAASDKLDAIIVNGINIGAAKAGADLAGKMTVEVQNKVLADAVNYSKDHGANTISDLAASNGGVFSFLKGFDPNDPKVHEALAARATATLNTLSPDTVIAAASLPTAPPVTAS